MLTVVVCKTAKPQVRWRLDCWPSFHKPDNLCKALKTRDNAAPISIPTAMQTNQSARKGRSKGLTVVCCRTAASLVVVCKAKTQLSACHW